jgi:hypothetical protein
MQEVSGSIPLGSTILCLIPRWRAWIALKADLV